MNYQNYQNVILLTSSDIKRTLMHSCLQIPSRENWFQYVHKVYATAIYFSFHYNLGPYNLLLSFVSVQSVFTTPLPPPELYKNILSFNSLFTLFKIRAHSLSEGQDVSSSSEIILSRESIDISYRLNSKKPFPFTNKLQTIPRKLSNISNKYIFIYINMYFCIFI